jgi:hypothetical protein
MRMPFTESFNAGTLCQLSSTAHAHKSAPSQKQLLSCSFCRTSMQLLHGHRTRSLFDKRQQGGVTLYMVETRCQTHRRHASRGSWMSGGNRGWRRVSCCPDRISGHRRVRNGFPRMVHAVQSGVSRDMRALQVNQDHQVVSPPLVGVWSLRL